MAVVEAGQVN